MTDERHGGEATPLTPFWTCDYATVYAGDCLRVIRSMPDQSVDAVVTDPPYSSGGLMRADRNRGTSDKYVLTGTERQNPEFFGDNRDQRSFLAWASMWLTECYRVTREGGALMCFTDWRQIPVMSDAIQCGGYVWRGIVPWDKTEAVRPQRGWFRAQCEYVLTATRGSLGKEQERAVAACLPGVIRQSVRAHEKQHITAKPVALMQQLLQVLPPGSTVLDPFAGSGTTALAAKNLNLKSISVEMSAEYCGRIRHRLAQDVLPLFGGADNRDGEEEGT
jgi:site-specific DNA-methyltransferase (adenine-specific)